MCTNLWGSWPINSLDCVKVHRSVYRVLFLFHTGLSLLCVTFWSKWEKKKIGGLGRPMCSRGEVMLKGGRGGGELPPFHLTSPLFCFTTNVNADNKASFAYHNPHLSTFWSGVLGSPTVFFQKEEQERKKNFVLPAKAVWSSLPEFK